ncbi:FAD-dependent monooxygenase [Streptomyces sp. NPDC048664]|uniref:FAD-dependent monooxygenase n=1 Tax=Streptomyces sp. NPDC048664 TaxID=3154505 RepID=UPI00343A737B
MAESHTPVLVVGGGPVGLALSCLLSDQGVNHMLIESHPGTSRHPKARGVSARSMEIFRRLGLEKEVRAAGLPAEQVRFYRGRDLVDPDYVRNGLAQEPGEGPEPSPGLICPQDALEPLLLRRAAERAGSRIRFAARLVSFEDDGLGVRAVVEDRATGRLDHLRADWLVGCDGAASTVRRPDDPSGPRTARTRGPVTPAGTARPVNPRSPGVHDGPNPIGSQPTA